MTHLCSFCRARALKKGCFSLEFKGMLKLKGHVKLTVKWEAWLGMTENTVDMGHQKQSISWVCDEVV